MGTPLVLLDLLLAMTRLGDHYPEHGGCPMLQMVSVYFYNQLQTLYITHLHTLTAVVSLSKKDCTILNILKLK